MKPETINEIRRALNNSNLWFYDPETNALFVQPEKLMYKAVAFPPELQSSIPAACVLLQHAPALLDEIERLQAELKRWTGVFTGVTPEDMRRRMMDMSVAHAWLSEENFRLTAYVAELEEKLETTRMQLAACDVVANSNTPESAQEHRQMSSRYKSAALLSVESAVDREMELRQRVAELEPASATTQPITPPTPWPERTCGECAWRCQGIVRDPDILQLYCRREFTGIVLYLDTPACPAFVAREEAQPHKCAWRQDEYTGAYHTACGHMWQFTEGGLVDNDTRYCPYCGGLVQEGEEEE